MRSSIILHSAVLSPSMELNGGIHIGRDIRYLHGADLRATRSVGCGMNLRTRGDFNVHYPE